jgi:hypothetical protein
MRWIGRRMPMRPACDVRILRDDGHHRASRGWLVVAPSAVLRLIHSLVGDAPVEPVTRGTG